MTELARRSDAPVFGIVMMCTSVLFMIAMGVLMKQLTQEIHTAQIMWARYIGHMAIIPLLFPQHLRTLLVSQRKDLQFVRSGLMLVGTTLGVTSLRYMPLADVVAITYLAPVLITALSVFLLGEVVGLRRWLSVAAGFIGVLVIVRPGLGGFGWPVLLPLGFALTYALYQILTRMVSQASTPVTSLFYAGSIGAVLTTLVAPFFWTEPTLAGWIMLVGVGFTAGLGHFLVIKAYERSEASVVAPFGYFEIIGATIAGYVFFADFPDGWTLVGAAIITASGLYILHRERIRNAP